VRAAFELGGVLLLVERHPLEVEADRTDLDAHRLRLVGIEVAAVHIREPELQGLQRLRHIGRERIRHGALVPTAAFVQPGPARE
jgi:hypothetical protein